MGLSWQSVKSEKQNKVLGYSERGEYTRQSYPSIMLGVCIVKHQERRSRMTSSTRSYLAGFTLEISTMVQEL